MKWVLVIVGFLFSAAFLFGGARSVLAAQHAQEHLAVTTATVVDTTSHPHRKERTTYGAEVEFHTADGRTIRTPAQGTSLDPFTVGETVEISYDAEHPENAYLYGATWGVSDGMVGVVLGGLGILASLAGLVWSVRLTVLAPATD